MKYDLKKQIENQHSFLQFSFSISEFFNSPYTSMTSSYKPYPDNFSISKGFF